MKKYLYTTGTIAFALAMSAAPVMAYAEDPESSEEATVSVTATAEANSQETEDSQNRPRPTPQQLRAMVASTSARVTPEMRERAEEALKKAQEIEKKRLYMGSTSVASSSEAREARREEMQQAREDVKQQVGEVRETFKTQLEALREGSTTPAANAAQLKQMIEERRMAIKNIVASSTPAEKKVLEHASRVSVAVHALLSSRELLGGLGQQVSDIAKGVDDSIATTTAAESKIEGRGFLTKLLFGGDANAAATIRDQVAQNQERIIQLAGILNQATTSADVKAELQAQLDALNAEQVRLQNVASSQQKLWGLFSWRL